MDAEYHAVCVKHDVHINGLVISVIPLNGMLVQSLNDFTIVHNHSTYEMRLILNGSGYAEVENEVYQVDSGDIFIVPPLMYHSFLPGKDSQAYYLSCRLDIKPDTVSSDASASFERVSGHMGKPIKLHPEDALIPQLFQRMLDEFVTMRPGYLSRIAALSTTLILYLMQMLFPDTDLRWSDECTEYDILREVDIEQFFADHYAENVTIRDLAADLYVSPRHINRILQALYHCSFVDKLIMTRLENAKHQLRYSKMRVSEIAEKCGFRTVSYFNTSFRRHFGYTPSQYVALHAKPELRG